MLASCRSDVIAKPLGPRLRPLVPPRRARADRPLPERPSSPQAKKARAHLVDDCERMGLRSGQAA